MKTFHKVMDHVISLWCVLCSAWAATSFRMIAEIQGIHDGRADQVSAFYVVTVIVVSALVCVDARSRHYDQDGVYIKAAIVAWLTVMVVHHLLDLSIGVTPPQAWLAVTAAYLLATTAAVKVQRARSLPR